MRAIAQAEKAIAEAELAKALAEAATPPAPELTAQEKAVAALEELLKEIGSRKVTFIRSVYGQREDKYLGFMKYQERAVYDGIRYDIQKTNSITSPFRATVFVDEERRTAGSKDTFDYKWRENDEFTDYSTVELAEQQTEWSDWELRRFSTGKDNYEFIGGVYLYSKGKWHYVGASSNMDGEGYFPFDKKIVSHSWNVYKILSQEGFSE